MAHSSGCHWGARRAIALIYVMIAMVVFLGFAVYAVDVGRLMLARTELQTVADAAARYAAVGMSTSSSKHTTAYNHAASVCAESKVDGRVAAIGTSDVQVGIWNPATRTFTVSSNNALINAVRVSLNFSVGAAGSPPTFAAAMGGGATTIQVVSVASATVTSLDITAPSQGNLWLAGAPYNTTLTNLQSNTSKYDSSGTASTPKQRPQEILLTSMGAAAGDYISFEGVDGQASNGGGAVGTTGPDGNTGWNVALGNSAPTSVPNTSANGISNMRAPISSFIAVFLSDAAPSQTAAPAGLDFGTAASRDYSKLEPRLKQTFFVGDGKRSNGEVQRIKVPAGATRVFLGMMDAWQWNDNTGSFQLKLYKGTTVSTVK